MTKGKERIKSGKELLNDDMIVNLQGKEFVLYEGLLALTHEIGVKKIETDLIQIPNKDNQMTAICKARIYISENEYFDGIGDAAPNSVGNFLIPHIIRMAETRAKARAMRDLTNIGMTAFDEVIPDQIAGNNGNNNNKRYNNNYKKPVNKPINKQAAPEAATQPQLNLIYKLCNDKGFSEADQAAILKQYKVKTFNELTKAAASSVINRLNNTEVKQ